MHGIYYQHNPAIFTGDTFCAYQLNPIRVDSDFLLRRMVFTPIADTVLAIFGGAYTGQGFYLRDEKTKTYYKVVTPDGLGNKRLSMHAIYRKNISNNANGDLVVYYAINSDSSGVSHIVTHLAVIDYTHMKLLFDKTINDYETRPAADNTSDSASIVFWLEPVFKAGEIDFNETFCNGCNEPKTQAYLSKSDCFIRKK